MEPFAFTDRRAPIDSGKVDARIRRTRERLSNALVSLLSERPYDEISVQDIVQRAAIKRSTFYLHFSEKNDLFGYVTREDAEELVALLQAEPDRPGMSPREWSMLRYERFLSHIKERAVLYRAMLCGTDASRYGARLIELIQLSAIQAVRRVATEEVAADEDRIVLIALYGAAGLTGILRWWLDTDTHVPVSNLASLITDLLLGGPLEAAGVLPHMDFDAR